MHVGNMEHRESENKTKRSINRAVEARKASAANTLEEADQAKVAHRTREQRKCQSKG